MTAVAAINPVRHKLPLTDWKRTIWCSAHKVGGMMSAMASPSAASAMTGYTGLAGNSSFLTSWSRISTVPITVGLRLTNNYGGKHETMVLVCCL